MVLSDREIGFLIETLLTCRDEFNELYRTKDWFVSDAADLIDSSLEILEYKEEQRNGEDSGLGFGDE